MKNLIDIKLSSPNQIKLSEQIKIVALTVLITVIPVTLIFAFFKLVKNTSLDFLTRDPSVLTNTPFYIGFFSSIGILLWCACAAICLFSYAILRQNNRSRELSKFLLFSGLLTSFLMIDDVFLLHEVVFPEYLNIKEKLVYAFYIIVVLFIFIKTIKVIKTTEFVIFLAAMGFFALSILSDTVHNSYAISIIEDVFKIVGIASWFTYFIRGCLKSFRESKFKQVAAP